MPDSQPATDPASRKRNPWSETAPWVGTWILLVVIALACRPPLPVDETRYLTVAWEMWLRGGFLVPHLHGMPYSDKPPMLFWLILVGWRMLGVQEWWARLVSPLFGLGSLFLVRALARRLWPERTQVHALAPLLVLSMLLWTIWTTVTMFDVLLTFGVLLAVHGAVLVWRSGSWRPWAIVVAGLAFGILSKGPVVLLVVLPPLLLAPWWMADERLRSWTGWYAGLAGAVLGAVVLVLAWAVPAARAGGPAYAQAIFFGQVTKRLAHTHIHARPDWFYLALLAPLLFPLSVWPPLWRAARSWRRTTRDPGVRFCVAWIVLELLAFSLIRSKQVHYLLTLVPAVGLLAAYLVTRFPIPGRRSDTALPLVGLAVIALLLLSIPVVAGGREDVAPWLVLSAPQLAAGAFTLVGVLAVVLRPGAGRTRPWELLLVSAAFFAAVHVAFLTVARTSYDLRSMAVRLQQLQEEGYTVGYAGNYHGQFGFLGRLRTPVQPVPRSGAIAWLQADREHRLLVIDLPGRVPRGQVHTIYLHRYQDGWKAVVQAPVGRSARTGQRLRGSSGTARRRGSPARRRAG